MGRAVERLPGEDGKPSVCGRAVHRLRSELLSHVQIRHLTEEHQSVSRAENSLGLVNDRQSADLGVVTSSGTGSMLLQVITTADGLTRVALRVRVALII